MSVFQYKAINKKGEEIDGQMEAENEMAIIEHLQDAGYIPVQVKYARATQSLFSFKKRRSPLADAEVIQFSQKLSMVLKSGMPLDEALNLLADLSETEDFSVLVKSIAKNVRSGERLSQALSSYPEYFRDFYVNTIRAGETAGAVPEVLNRLAQYMNNARELKENIRTALVYPAILIVVAILSLILLLVYVVPQFEPMFADLGDALPVSTQVVLSGSKFISEYFWLILLGVLSIYLLARQQFSKPGNRLMLHQWLLKMPLSAELTTKIDVARFSRTLAVLLENGVPIVTSMGIVSGVMNNLVLQSAVLKAADGLKEGMGIYRPLTQSGYFPELALKLIKVGEETGGLEKMLYQIADVYDQEVKVNTQRLLLLLEPALIITLGLLVAGIILSILMGILSVNDLAF